MTNLFGSLDIDVWGLFGIWCLEFDISEYLHTRGMVSLKITSLLGIVPFSFLRGLFNRPFRRIVNIKTP